jgi:hypothetical protein
MNIFTFTDIVNVYLQLMDTGACQRDKTLLSSDEHYCCVFGKFYLKIAARDWLSRLRFSWISTIPLNQMSE